jgi:2-amino-4-hydroxy-6-hydroxymethyldihydropteridine diphosphokinase
MLISVGKKFPSATASSIMKKSYIGLGSNIGRRTHNLTAALQEICAVRGIRVARRSHIYQTKPVGGPPQRDFLNAVIEIRTHLPPAELIHQLKAIEKKLGRRIRRRWFPRPIDLDILTYGHRCYTGRGLIIPHPRYHLRRFVLVPFCELAPNWFHPRIKKKNASFLAELTPRDQRVTMVGPWTKSLSKPSKNEKTTKSR